MKNIKLAIGFLVYGEATAKYLPDFLSSLKKSLLYAGCEWRCYAWDNQPSNPVNQQYLADQAAWVEIHQADDNLGFGAAYNRLFPIAKAWGADYFLVVNPDTYWSEEAVAMLLSALAIDDSLASATPKVLYWDFASRRLTKRIDTCGLQRLPGLQFIDLGQGQIDYGQCDNSKIIGASGCAALFRLSALEAVAVDGQIFDETMFMYKEDCDLAMRLWLADYQAALVVGAKVWHDRTAAASGHGLWSKIKAMTTKSATVRRWSLENQLLLVKKYWRQESWLGLAKLVLNLGLRFLQTLVFERKNLSVWKNFFKSL